MAEPTHQSHLAGEDFKPPKGALVKSQGAKRLGKVYPRDIFVKQNQYRRKIHWVNLFPIPNRFPVGMGKGDERK